MDAGAFWPSDGVDFRAGEVTIFKTGASPPGRRSAACRARARSFRFRSGSRRGTPGMPPARPHPRRAAKEPCISAAASASHPAVDLGRPRGARGCSNTRGPCANAAGFFGSLGPRSRAADSRRRRRLARGRQAGQGSSVNHRSRGPVSRPDPRARHASRSQASRHAAVRSRSARRIRFGPARFTRPRVLTSPPPHRRPRPPPAGGGGGQGALGQRGIPEGGEQPAFVPDPAFRPGVSNPLADSMSGPKRHRQTA